MMFRKSIRIFVFLMVLAAVPCCAKDYHIHSRIVAATKAVNRMASSSSAVGMAQCLKDGVGVAIFPEVVKAGILVGGRYGEGLVMHHDPRTGKWYGPAFFSLSGGSFGLQFGASKTALVLVVNTPDGMDMFRGGNFTLGVDVQAVAGPGGRESYIGTAANALAPVYSYSVSKGVFAGVSMEGSVMSELPGVNDACWGVHLNNRQMLSRSCPRDDVKALIRALNNLIRKSR